MRVLFLTQVLPYPLDAGPKIRAYYTLRHLAQRHRVTLVSFVRASDTPGALAHLAEFCEHVHTITISRSRLADALHLARSLTQTTPFLIQRDESPSMAALAQSLAASGAYDLIHADQLWMAPYAHLAYAAAPSNRRPARILDQHNAVFQIPRRMAQQTLNPLWRALLRLEERKLAAYEADQVAQFDATVWVTDEDRAALRDRVSGLPAPQPVSYQRPAIAARRLSTVIPICVAPDETASIQRQPDASRVTFLGGLHWPPNAEGVAWFIRQVWPQVREAAPHATLTLIGSRPPKHLQRLAQPGSGIELLGYVDDPSLYLAETGVFIVPLLSGGGMRVKILDAWAWGLPMVSTTIGAEGQAVHDGQNILLADTPDRFANAVVRLLRQTGLAEKLATAGRQTVETSYNWRRTYTAWDKVYDQLAQPTTERILV